MPDRIGILATHPVQYYAPWFKYLAERMDLTVYYAHEQSPKEQAAAGFGVEFDWDTKLLDGYEYQWLHDESPGRSGVEFLRYNTPEIYDIIETGGFSGFLVLGWNFRCAWQACRACLKNGVPVFMRGDSQLRSHRSPMKLLLKRAVYPYGLGLFSGHLFVGTRNRDYLREYGVPEENLHFSPHFVDNEFLRESADAAEVTGESASIRNRHGIGGDAFVYAFFGKLIERKHPDAFLEGVKRYLLETDERDIHALFVGDGPLKESLMETANTLGERVHFAGFVNQSRIGAYYRAADAIVLPSDARETWGLVVNEAAACGRPSIVSEDVGCAPDLIDNRRTGFSYRPGDGAELVDRMISARRMCTDDAMEVRQALSELSSRYSISKATDGLLSAMDVARGRP